MSTVLLLALAASAAPNPPPLESSMPEPTTDAEVSRHLAAARTTRGSPPDVRERDRAVAWLLAHADVAFPIVLESARGKPADATLIELLGWFRRAEATPVLLQAFGGDAWVRQYAAGALGASPDPAARVALVTSLNSTDAGVVVAALAGLGASTDPAACAHVLPHIRSPGVEIRWMAVHAAATLGCIGRAELAEIANMDTDATVRALAAERAAR